MKPKPIMSESLIGLVPAAEKGIRLAPFPCPKELFPVGYQDYPLPGRVEKRPKVISQYLIENILHAGVKKLLVVLGPGKHDIMSHYGDGSRHGCEIAYLFQEQLTGMPGALDLAHDWASEATVLFGMPDTIIEPKDAFKRMLADHHGSGAMLLWAFSRPTILKSSGWLILTVHAKFSPRLTSPNIPV